MLDSHRMDPTATPHRADVLRILQDNRAKLAALGVTSLWLFGSVAREEARPESDIDILVDLSPPLTWDKYTDVGFFLEDLFGRKVDVVLRDGLKPRIRPSVEQDAVLVA